jgi:hypothetical protein
MMAIPREAGRITYSTNIRNLKRMVLSEEQKAIIIGSILGDACLHENWSKTNYRLQIRHSKDQEEYVRWKYERLKNLVLTPPQFYGRTRSVWFRTISHPELSKLHQLFYQNGTKIIPKWIEKYLANPVTIAVWFMDDGNAVKRHGKLIGYHLNTQSFSKQENEKLKEAFFSVYGINCSIERNHKYYRLAFYAEVSRKYLTDLIRGYIIPSLKYKIG